MDIEEKNFMKLAGKKLCLEEFKEDVVEICKRCVREAFKKKIIDRLSVMRNGDERVVFVVLRNRCYTFYCKKETCKYNLEHMVLSQDES